MVQEALTNIEKHSRAGRVVLVVRELAGPVLPEGSSVAAGSSPGILICISDDGIGLNPEGARGESASLGLRIMRERAAAIGARLDFVSESGNGLMVRIELPSYHPRSGF
jgi:two-component system nitrate/nitrite sensor histidine kinase NarX